MRTPSCYADAVLAEKAAEPQPPNRGEHSPYGAIARYRPAFSQLVRHKGMLQGLEEEGRDPLDPGTKSSTKI